MSKYFIIALMIAIVFAGCTSTNPQTTVNQTVQITQNITNSTANSAPVVICNETGSINNTLIQGQVTTDNGIFVDQCSGPNSVTKFYCSNGQVANKTINCDTGFECTNGACVLKMQQNFCTDNNESQNPYVRGQVIANGVTYQDTCPNENEVEKYHCLNGSATSLDIPCPVNSICQNGQCTMISNSCTESGVTRDEYVNSSVTFTDSRGSSTESDFCLGDSSVRKFYCQSGSIASEDIDCTNGTACENGRCINSNCMDSNPSDSPLIQGVVTMGETMYPDYCSNQNVAIRYYCDQNQVQQAPDICPTGYACSNGVCQVSAVSQEHGTTGCTLLTSADLMPGDSITFNQDSLYLNDTEGTTPELFDLVINSQSGQIPLQIPVGSDVHTLVDGTDTDVVANTNTQGNPSIQIWNCNS